MPAQDPQDDGVRLRVATIGAQRSLSATITSNVYSDLAVNSTIFLAHSMRRYPVLQRTEVTLARTLSIRFSSLPTSANSWGQRFRENMWRSPLYS